MRERIAFADYNDWEIAVAIGERGKETWRYSVDSDVVVVLRFKLHGDSNCLFMDIYSKIICVGCSHCS